YLDALLSAFNEAYKEEGIQAVDANMEEYSNLAENGPYGYGPDVLYQANDILMTYAEDKHIVALPVEDYECYDKTPKEAWDAFKTISDGKEYYYGVPVNVQEPMLFYREDMMPENWEKDWDDDKNGVADFFENWTDLYAYSRLLRDSDKDGNSKYGFVASLNDFYMMAGFVFSYGGYVFGTNSDGTVNTEDIGLGAGNAATGLLAMKQFAGLMGKECIDDSVKTSRYSNVANGTYFCSVSTPDTYVLFHERLKEVYAGEGLGDEEAEKKAAENLKMIELPKLLPADGDLSKDSSTMSGSDWVSNVVMGGINGYGISAYTKNREACEKFVKFATSFDMVKKRAELLGIAPTRSDASKDAGGVADAIFGSLNEGSIYLMPSVKAVDQIWDPVQTLFGDVAKDAFRAKDGETVKYKNEADMKAALEKASKNIYDAIYVLAK
ncbi:MAG: extracellular solute-binding protein, partial [Lachnospiraceae bacterium]|nr:extracellular solute-binding protein [Lachnospiraceae bacterium]